MNSWIQAFNKQMENRNIPISCDVPYYSDFFEMFTDFDKLLISYFGEGEFFLAKKDIERLCAYGSRLIVPFGSTMEVFRAGLKRIDKALLRKKLQEV